jgi:septal ring factor EnvC (AmiA/AmiB activator)
MEIQQKYTISEATAFLGFKSRSTINSRTKDKGTKSLSYETDDSGNKVISILELERVFPAKYAAAIKKKKNTSNTSTEYSNNAPKNTSNTIQLQHKVEMLEQELDSTKNALNKSEEREADLSKKLDKTQDSLQISLRQLEDTREKSPEKPPEKKKGFWGSLFS